ncbi:MAG: methyltransferase domain-containing protein [Sphingobium sp.]|nr:methyltransferase domain-containing protein [Sphingobium sp.]
MSGPGAARLLLLGLTALALAGCDRMPFAKSETDRRFPSADRPVAPIISTRWSTEEARDRVHEAQDIMNSAGITPGMTVADIGAGEGYYTVRLAKRVGPKGRVLAEDIVAEVIDALGRRVTRENWDNVSVKLGTPDDPKLPAASFDRVFMVHMYHEITEPYAFLWHLYPALKPKGEVIVVEPNRPPEQHGMPPELLRCEFAAVGYVQRDYVQRPAAGGYMARFVPGAAKPVDPSQIVPCRLRRPEDTAALQTPAKDE